MAYMSQEKKAEIQRELKKIIPATWKWSLGVNHHSTLRLTIQSAPVDLLGELNRVHAEKYQGPFSPPHDADYAQVNEYYLDNQFDRSLPLMQKIKAAMMAGNHDNSDAMTDYFDVGWYISINLGRYDKPFVCTRIGWAEPHEETTEAKIVRLEQENEKLRARL